MLANLYLIWANSIELRLVVFGFVMSWIVMVGVAILIGLKNAREFNEKNGQRDLLSQLAKTRRKQERLKAQRQRGKDSNADLEEPLKDTLDIINGASGALSEILRRM